MRARSPFNVGTFLLTVLVLLAITQAGTPTVDDPPHLTPDISTTAQPDPRP